MAAGSAWPTKAEPVDLELVLAVDISGSVDPDEARLQRDGYLSALTDPEVVRTIRQGMLGKIAVTYVEWAGTGTAYTVAEWTLVKDEESARNFTDTIAKAPLQTARWTSISNAIEYALPRFENNGFEGTRRAIDISGDGPNNQGGLVTQRRDMAAAAGVTINGLPIVNDRASPFGWPALPNLDLYYANCVIGGPGAFYVVANNFNDFARAIRKKLILEIAAEPQAARLFHAAARTPPPCDVGERRVQWLLDP